MGGEFPLRINTYKNGEKIQGLSIFGKSRQESLVQAKLIKKKMSEMSYSRQRSISTRWGEDDWNWDDFLGDWWGGDDPYYMGYDDYGFHYWYGEDGDGNGYWFIDDGNSGIPDATTTDPFEGSGGGDWGWGDDGWNDWDWGDDGGGDNGGGDDWEWPDPDDGYYENENGGIPNEKPISPYPKEGEILKPDEELLEEVHGLLEDLKKLGFATDHISIKIDQGQVAFAWVYQEGEIFIHREIFQRINENEKKAVLAHEYYHATNLLDYSKELIKLPERRYLDFPRHIYDYVWEQIKKMPYYEIYSEEMKQEEEDKLLGVLYLHDANWYINEINAINFEKELYPSVSPEYDAKREYDLWRWTTIYNKFYAN